MNRRKEDPAKHVISFRVTESEREMLLEMSRTYGGNITILLRRQLNLLGECNAEIAAMR
jgi:hypothetical protein